MSLANVDNLIIAEIISISISSYSEVEDAVKYLKVI